MNLSTLTAKDLRRAADLRERIDALEQELNELLGHTTAKAPATAPVAGKRRLSAAGKARIAAAAKARWAAFRKSKGTSEVAAEKPAKKRKFSPAARARLAASARARWAKAKAAGKATL